MLYRTLHNNSLAAFILVPFILLIFWVRVFLFDGVQPISFDGMTMPLWEWLVRSVFSPSAFWSALFSYLLAVAIAFTVNRIVARHGILSRQSVLPALFYGLLVSSFLVVQRLHVVWVFSLFLLLAVERLMGAANSSRKESRCFDAALLTGFGALMYVKGIYFFPVLIVTMGVLRMLTFKTFLASLMGLLLPFILSAGYFFLFSDVEEFGVFVLLNLLTNVGQFSHDIASEIYIGLVVILTLIGTINVVRYIPVQKIITRKHLRVIIWFILLTAAACLTPFFSVEITPILAIGPAVVVSFWVDKMKRTLSGEIFLWFLVVVTIAAQLFM